MGVSFSGTYKSLGSFKTGTLIEEAGVTIPTTNLALHLDANDTNSLTLDGSNGVDQWNDLSGNNNNATPLNVNKPVWSANAFPGSMPGITFTSANQDAFTGPDNNFSFNNATRTLFIVAYPTSGAQESMFMQGVNNSGQRWDIRISGDDIRVDTSGEQVSWGTFVGPNNAQLITIVYDGVELNTTEVIVNGVTGSITNTFGSAALSTADDAYYIGARINDFYYNGVIAEIAYYNTQLDSGTISNIQSTLSSKWGL